MKRTSNTGTPRPFVLALALTMTLLSIQPARGQGNDDLTNRANAAVQEGNWTEAAKLYTELTGASPENARAWYRLGLSLVNSGGSTSEARTAFEKAAELGFPAAPAYFGIARSHAKDGNSRNAFKTLEELAERGPSPFVVSRLEADPLFAPYAGTKRFKAVVQSLTPCTSEEYRQFDFWLGNWDVYSPQGQLVGTNHVTQTMDGCVLMENWASASGGQKGMSMNYYDRDKGTWSQIYRDNSGNITQWPELVGGLVDGSMVLDSGPETNPRSKWSWTLGEDGRVRQMAEQTTDGGETWTVVWDSYYKLKEE